MDCEAINILDCMLLDATIKPTKLPLTLLQAITNNFSDDQNIGSGGFATVYKGLLENGTVAVKRLLEIEVDEKKFNQEIDSLMRVNHENIVRFLGYCAVTEGEVWNYERKNVLAEKRQRLLCFEFLSKGSLNNYISDASGGLEWRTRYQIIKGICEGLHYLHNHEKIVHSDLKPANILLDHNMNPKITDFGLSRCFDGKQTQAVTSHPFGTLGYMAPELYGGLITFKLDIYSLGIIIIEILTGRKGYQEIENVLERWSMRFQTSQQGATLLEHVRVCAEIGLQCMDSNPVKRPNIWNIINELGDLEHIYGLTETDLSATSIEIAPEQPSHQPEETSEFVTDPPESSLPDPTKVLNMDDWISHHAMLFIEDEFSFMSDMMSLRHTLALHLDSEDILDNHYFGNLSDTREHQLLKPHTIGQPARWLQISLKVCDENTSWITLFIRGDNVSVQGFMNQSNKDYGYYNYQTGDSAPTTDEHWTTPTGWNLLDWGNSYMSILDARDAEEVVARLDALRLGKTFAEDAVRVLSCYPDVADDIATISPRLALVGLSVMFCDSLKLNPVHDTVARGWNTGMGFSQQLMDYILNWERMSSALRDWKENDRYQGWIKDQELERIGIKSPKDALDVVHLVHNDIGRQQRVLTDST